MQVFAIGDLHLSGNGSKPMDIFGVQWQDHWLKIVDNWNSTVRSEDVVLIPGDISWAMKIEDAEVDLNLISELPGKKVIIRGNHDYWWNSISKVRSILPPNFYALQNDSLEINGIHFCGTRGWNSPGSKDFSEHDMKIFHREKDRLSLSLSTARMARDIVLLFHYPPFDHNGLIAQISDRFAGYPISNVVFGHLHGPFHNVVEGEFDGIGFHLVSCDYLDFKLKLII